MSDKQAARVISLENQNERLASTNEELAQALEQAQKRVAELESALRGSEAEESESRRRCEALEKRNRSLRDGLKAVLGIRNRARGHASFKPQSPSGEMAKDIADGLTAALDISGLLGWVGQSAQSGGNSADTGGE